MKNEEIGALLKRLRLEHKLTQAELAEKVYVTPQAVSRWEKGINTPNLVTLVELKKLYRVSVDELLLDVSKKVIPVRPDKEAHWALRYVLYPFVLLFLCFGLSQFYFFLNVLYVWLAVALFFCVLLTAVMLVLKVRQKGPLFLIALGVLLVVNGTIYFANQPYYDLMEIPYLLVEDVHFTGQHNLNRRPVSENYRLDDSPWLLRFHEGAAGVQLIDLSLSIEEMTTLIETPEPVQQAVFLDDKAYLICHEWEASTSNLYELDLRTHELTLVHQGTKQYRLVSSPTTLYLYEAFDRSVDASETMYRFEDEQLVVAHVFPFDLYEVVYSPGSFNFYYSVIYSFVDPTANSNVLIYNEDFMLQGRVFDTNQQENFTFKAIRHFVFTAQDSRLLIINWTDVTRTDLYADVRMLHDSGMHFVLHGNLMNSQWQILTEDIIRDRDYRLIGGHELYWLEETNRYIAFDDDMIYLLRPYSRQIESIVIPSYARHAWFFGVMPFIALFVTLGAKQTFELKPKRTKQIAVATPQS